MGYLINKIKIENPSIAVLFPNVHTKKPQFVIFIPKYLYIKLLDLVTQFPYEQKNVEGKLKLIFPI